MTLPTFTCPICRNQLTWETIFSHEGVREAMLALVNAHPSASKLLRPLLGYVGMFAPEKTAMRYERIAALLDELVAMIQSAKVKRDGTVYAAPLDYWANAFNEVLARRDAGTLRLPLSSHGYLMEIIVGYSKKADAAAETIREKQRAGHAGFGGTTTQISTETGPVKLDASLSKTKMPEHVREALKKIKGENDGNKKT